MNQSIFEQHREELLDEQRVPFGRLHDLSLKRRRRGRPTKQIRHEPRDLVLVQRPEQGRCRTELAARPSRPVVEELRTGDHEQEDGSPA